MVQTAWTGLGNSWIDLEKVNWFDRYGDDAAEVRDRLHPTLVSFLEQAFDWDPSVMSLNYFAWTLNSPNDLWENHDVDVAEFDDESRFLTLYTVNPNLGNPPEGLKYIGDAFGRHRFAKS